VQTTAASELDAVTRLVLLSVAVGLSASQREAARCARRSLHVAFRFLSVFVGSEELDEKARACVGLSAQHRHHLVDSEGDGGL